MKHCSLKQFFIVLLKFCNILSDKCCVLMLASHATMQIKVESDFLDEAETDYSSYQPSYSDVSYYDDDNNNTRVKRAKHIFIDDIGASSSHLGDPWSMGQRAGTNDMSVKVELEAMTPGRRANVQGDLAKPPFFLYENVIEIPKIHETSGVKRKHVGI